MAITHQGSNTSYYSTTGTSLTQAIDVGSGSNRLLIVSVFTEYDNQTPTATFNGVAMTRLISQKYDTQHTRRDLHIFVLANPDSGSHNFVVTCANSGLITMGYSCYNGVDQTTPTPTTAYGSKGSSATCEATLTIANSDSWMFATMMTNNGHSAATWGAGTGTTKRGFMFGFSVYQAGCNYDSNGGLATGSRTIIANNSEADSWGIWIGVEIKPTSSYSIDVETGGMIITGNDVSIDLGINVATGGLVITGNDVGITRTGINWENQTKNTASWSNPSKNSSSWDNQNRN